jgi:hypothetical protein
LFLQEPAGVLFIETLHTFSYPAHALAPASIILMTLSTTLLLFGGGILTGTVGAMLGLGGGVFLIPFLVIVLELPMHQAIATSILAVIATSSAGAVMNLERGMVNIRLGMVLETATVAGAMFGGITANYLSAETLRQIFAVLLFVVSGVMFWKIRQSPRGDVAHEGTLRAEYTDDATGQIVSYGVRRMPVIMGVSLAAGNISGLLGVGGGIFKVPAMTLLGGMPMKAATATSNFMIGVTAAASAFIYLANGHMNPLVAAPTALGVLCGSFLGIRISRTIQSKVLTVFFALFLLFVAVQFISR